MEHFEAQDKKTKEISKEDKEQREVKQFKMEMFKLEAQAERDLSTIRQAPDGHKEAGAQKAKHYMENIWPTLVEDHFSAPEKRDLMKALAGKQPAQSILRYDWNELGIDATKYYIACRFNWEVKADGKLIHDLKTIDWRYDNEHPEF